MISGKRLHGLRVYDESGTQLGIVQDMAADSSTGAIKGFIVSSAGILARNAFVSVDSVLRLDEDGMVITDNAQMKKGMAVRRMANDLHLGELTSSRGHVTDILLEKDRVWAAEISGGLMSDMRSGRQVYSWDEL